MNTSYRDPNEGACLRREALFEEHRRELDHAGAASAIARRRFARAWFGGALVLGAFALAAAAIGDLVGVLAISLTLCLAMTWIVAGIAWLLAWKLAPRRPRALDFRASADA